MEDPAYLVRPETLATGDFLHWPVAPLPACSGWLSHAFFPRSAMAGMLPLLYDEAVIRPDQFAEVQQGIVRAETVALSSKPEQRFDLGFAQGAALGMRAAAITAGEPVELIHVHPRSSRWAFNLSQEVPKMALQMPDQPPLELVPSIRTLLIEPDLDRVCLVWVAEHPQALPVGPGKLAKTRFGVRW